MPQLNRATVCLSFCLSVCLQNEQKKAGQVPSIYDWRLRNEDSIYYGSPLVMYAYLYVCERDKGLWWGGGGRAGGIIIYMAPPLA